MKQRLRIADSNFNHGTSLGSGDLKIYPTYIQWERGNNRIGDVIVITDNFLQMVDRYDEPVKIAWLLEPPAYTKHTYAWIKNNYSKFDYVLTYDAELLDQIPNGHVYYYGGCWIEKSDRRIYNKTKNISIIVSDKKLTEGHRLRHEIVEKFGGVVDVFGKGYKPIHNKITALRNYRYSIVVENERKENWMTEKIIDCFMTGTIPIYYGANNIGKLFVDNSVLDFDGIEKLGQWFDGMFDQKGFYEKHIGDIRFNFQLAWNFAIPEDWLYLNFFKPKGLLK